MRLGLFCLLALVFVTSCQSPQKMPRENQTAHKFRKRVTHDLAANYLLHLPHDYTPKSRKRWPLILFLHGAGERGTNILRVAVHGPPKIVKTKADFPFILVSPQCPAGERWSNETLLALLDEIVRKHRADTDRIYLTGLSMGGYGTWALGTGHPHKFAAIAPICGGGETISILLSGGRHREHLKKLPVWAFHGAKDPVVKPEESEEMVSALKRIGNENIELTVYPEAAHDSWTETTTIPCSTSGFSRIICVSDGDSGAYVRLGCADEFPP